MNGYGEQTLFLVDDDEELAYLMSRCFQQAMPDANIVCFADARECMRRLETAEQPTMLITDLDMPRVNGFELIKWIRDQSALKFPLIVFSGGFFALNRDRCRQLGANAFVPKGMGFSDLMKCVRSFLDGEEPQQSGFNQLEDGTVA